jgi:hypothetical protein
VYALNFNFHLIFFLFLFSFLSCGVKGPPVAPNGTHIPPWESDFLQPAQVIVYQEKFKSQWEHIQRLQAELISISPQIEQKVGESRLKQSATKHFSPEENLLQIRELCSQALHIRQQYYQSAEKFIVTYQLYEAEIKRILNTRQLIVSRRSSLPLPPFSKILKTLDSLYFFNALNKTSLCNLPFTTW